MLRRVTVTPVISLGPMAASWEYSYQFPASKMPEDQCALKLKSAISGFPPAMAAEWIRVATLRTAGGERWTALKWPSKDHGVQNHKNSGRSSSIAVPGTPGSPSFLLFEFLCTVRHCFVIFGVLGRGAFFSLTGVLNCCAFRNHARRSVPFDVAVVYRCRRLQPDTALWRHFFVFARLHGGALQAQHCNIVCNYTRTRLQRLRRRTGLRVVFFKLSSL